MKMFRDMKSLISSMDIVVSAAGSTQFEVCACGVPMVIYSLADNQIPAMDALVERGLALSVGDLRRFADSGDSEGSAAEVILNALEELAGDYEKRCEMGRRMQELVDGMGAERCLDGCGTLRDKDEDEVLFECEGVRMPYKPWGELTDLMKTMRVFEHDVSNTLNACLEYKFVVDFF